ncbi:MAG: iron-sulfur cluster repair di-iron protein [Acidobacteria bacterium]|nr:iron-sulfur cluster repair di-iron protein [Acidobacteriota bacterium]
MTVSPNDLVSELAIRNRSAIPLFERLGIDYCCNGQRKLRDACGAAGIDAGAIVEELSRTNEPAQLAELTTKPLAELCAYIVRYHHQITRDELDRLGGLAAKVASKHGPNHPELAGVAAAFRRLTDDMLPHMMKEEQILFPFVAQLESEVSGGGALTPPFFGTVQNPIRMMLAEHDVVGDILRELRALTNGFNVPEDGCTSFRALYDGLSALELLTHEHIHIENNIAFPRAVELEARAMAPLRA